MKLLFGIYLLTTLLFVQQAPARYKESAKPASADTTIKSGVRPDTSVMKEETETGKKSGKTVLIVTSSSKEDSIAINAFSDSSVAVETKGALVTIKGQKVFTVYTNLGDYTPKQRAERIARLVDEFIKSDKPLDSIKIVNGTKLTSIRFGNHVIASVTDGDAHAQNLTRVELAEEWARELKELIGQYRKESGFYNILLKVGLVLAMLLALIFVWLWVTKLFKRLAEKISKAKGRHIPSLRFKNIELLPFERVTNFLIILSKALGIVIKAALVYAYLTSVFGLFIWTQNFAQTLIDLVVSPGKNLLTSLIAFLPNVISILVIVVIFRYIIKLNDIVFEKINSGELKISGFYQEWADPTRKVFKFLIHLFAAILIYPYTPIASSPAAQGISIFFGILFALGSSSAIGNIISSLLLNYTRAFKIGDRVKIGDVIGDIIEKTLLVTRIRTIKNEEVSLPNGGVMSSNILNYSEAVRRGEALIMYIEVSIGYDVPWRTVHDLLIKAAKETRLVLENPEPFVFQLSLRDNYPVYQLNVYTKDPKEMASIYSDLYANTQDKFNEANVEILSPTYQVHRLDNTSSIPSHYLPKDYDSPPIKVHLTNSDTKNNPPNQ
ncbi:MAG: mechanosensitive ion channel [Chlorobiales bacterium]|nr:mechanosensitive ion channel [Chlorobiales bacterium]